MPISEEEFNSLREGDEITVKATVRYAPDGAQVGADVCHRPIFIAREEILKVSRKHYRVGDWVNTPTGRGQVALVKNNYVVVDRDTWLECVLESEVCLAIRAEANA